jgi:hypothetical protein
MTTDERRFPIQGEWDDHPSRPRRYIPPCTVPWSVAARAYAVYDAKWRTGQSMERLAERGGFGRIELLWLLEGAPDSRDGSAKDYLAQPLPGEEPHA